MGRAKESLREGNVIVDLVLLKKINSNLEGLSFKYMEVLQDMIFSRQAEIVVKTELKTELIIQQN